jgi:hypothetical protein
VYPGERGGRVVVEVRRVGPVAIRFGKRELPYREVVSTSDVRSGLVPKEVARASDFPMVHFNGMKVDDIPARVKAMREFSKSVVCNEDTKTGDASAKAAELCVTAGGSWGLMPEEVNQHYPVRLPRRGGRQGHLRRTQEADAPVVTSSARHVASGTASFPLSTNRALHRGLS